MAEDLLRKVYDKYLGSDYEFGDSDLNPKREISKTSLEQIESEEKAIIEKIAERIKLLEAKTSSLPKYKIPEKIDNDNFVTESSGAGLGADPSPEENENELNMKISLGGNPNDSHILIPSGGNDSQVDFLMKELERVMIPIISMVNLSTNPSSTLGGGDLLELMNPGCDQYNVNSDEYETSDPNYNKLSLDEENQEDNENESSSNESSEETGYSSRKSSSEAADDAANENNEDRNRNVAEREREVIECITKEIPYLSSILATLKYINVIKKVLLLVLTIVVPTVKMIAFAAQCWINPPAAAQVVQMVAEKVAALLITTIGETLQMLWNYLELDCKTEQTQKILDNINEILTDVSSAIISGKNSTISMIKQSKSVYNVLSDSIDKFSQTSQWVDWTNDAAELLDFDFYKNEASKLLLGGEGLTTAGLKNLMNSTLPSDMKASLNKIANSAQAVVKNTKKVIASADFSSDTKTAGVQSTLDDLAGLLGTFRIK